MRKLFGGVNITWKFLVVFAIILGIGVGILNRIPILTNTSFQDIAVWPDMWFILAIFIIVNCKSSKEAVSKCFIFFLISQPLIYLTEIIIDVAINNGNFSTLFITYFNNYYLHGWFIWTLLTIPGAFIAYQIKKDNILAGIILSVATCYLAVVGTKGLINTFVNSFPYHLLNGLICVSMAFILIFVILKNDKAKKISFVITILGVIVGIVLFIRYNNNPVNTNEIISFDDGIVISDVYVEDSSIVTALLDEDGRGMQVVTQINVGYTRIIATSRDGKEYIYSVSLDNKELKIEKEDN